MFCEFSKFFIFVKKLHGKWQGKTAGGCSNNQETYGLNPTYHIVLNNREDTNCIKIELKGPQ